MDLRPFFGTPHVFLEPTSKEDPFFGSARGSGLAIFFAQAIITWGWTSASAMLNSFSAIALSYLEIILRAFAFSASLSSTDAER